MEIAMRQHLAEVARGVLVCPCTTDRTCGEECAFIAVRCACAIARRFGQDTTASEFSWDPSVGQDSPTRPSPSTPPAPVGSSGSPMKFLLQDRLPRRHDRGRHGPTYDQLNRGPSRNARREAEPTTPRRNKDATPLDFYSSNNSAQRYPVEAMLRNDTTRGPPPAFGTRTEHERLNMPLPRQTDPPGYLPIIQPFPSDNAQQSSAQTYDHSAFQQRDRYSSSEESASEGLFQKPITRPRAETAITPPGDTYTTPARAAPSYEPPKRTPARNIVLDRELPPLPTEPENPNGARPFTGVFPELIDDPAERAHAMTAAVESYARLPSRTPLSNDPLNPRPLPQGSAQRYVSAGGDLPLHLRPEVAGPMRAAQFDTPGFSADADEFLAHIRDREALDRMRQATFQQILQPTTPVPPRGRGLSGGQGTGGRTRDMIRRFLRKDGEAKESDGDR